MALIWALIAAVAVVDLVVTQPAATVQKFAMIPHPPSVGVAALEVVRA